MFSVNNSVAIAVMMRMARENISQTMAHMKNVLKEGKGGERGDKGGIKGKRREGIRGRRKRARGKEESEERKGGILQCMCSQIMVR